ncbi:porin [Celeribacter arenosi]|uniref:Porin n=1 Tax=Celeribacter arenosi TaxID=792649 RepID=A0ABP7JY28_9RHOB
MKKILLSSAAIVAFAGAASAEITLSGSATVGYNDDHEGGVYADADIDFTASQELNNGWTAALSYGIELEQLEYSDDDGMGIDQGGSFDGNVLFSISNDMYGLHYGDTEFAAASLWSGVSDMASDGFSEKDGEEILKFTGKMGGIEAAISAPVLNDSQELGQMSFGATGSFGNFGFGVAYQEEGEAMSATNGLEGDYNEEEILGLFVSTDLAGASIKVAYASNETAGTDSTGIEVSYPIGDVSVGAFYVSESDQDDGFGVSVDYASGPASVSAFYNEVDGAAEVGLEGSYAVNDDLTVFAGYIDDDNLEGGAYIGAEYDLGGGASFLASYGDADEEGDDEFGAKDYKDGMTVQLGLSF